MSEALKERLSKMLEDTDLCSDFMYEEDSRTSRKYEKDSRGKIVWDNYTDSVREGCEPYMDIKADFISSYGGEDCGSDYWSVVKFTDATGSVLVKFQGWYASYHGADYQDWSFVEPKQKTITVYE